MRSDVVTTRSGENKTECLVRMRQGRLMDEMRYEMRYDMIGYDSDECDMMSDMI